MVLEMIGHDRLDLIGKRRRLLRLDRARRCDKQCGGAKSPEHRFHRQPFRMQTIGSAFLDISRRADAEAAVATDGTSAGAYSPAAD
jgi:hypothetical protein